MERMLSVYMKGHITLFSIHGGHYVKVNMRYAVYAGYKIHMCTIFYVKKTMQLS